MKKFKRFFASILCVCMIITSCPDILAWAAGDTAVVKTTKFEFSAKKLSRMVQKADKGNTEDNGLCKLSVPKAMNYGKQLKLRAYLQEDEENIVFLFVNKTKKRHAAAIIVDDMMSDIIAVSTKQELLDEEYATDSNSDYDYDVYTDGLLDADFMDMAAEVLDGTANPSDNDADKEYDHLDGEAFDVVLRDGTVGAALVVSLEALGLDDMGELLPDDEDDEERSVVIASDSNAGSAVVLPGKDTAVVVPGADTPVVLPDQDQRPVVVDLPVATPSNSNVTVATPSNVAKTFIQELNGVKIKAHAEAGVIPDEATFEAIELKETGDTADAYKEACATLDADEETEYDGVMAYDLHFLLDGEEIQPDGEVKITMEVSEKALPENVDPESLEVKHLDETSGTTAVVTVADTGAKAEGTIAVNESAMAASEESDVAEQKTTKTNETAVTAEFTVDSFSYFAITYSHNNGKSNPHLKMTLLDSNGKAVPEDLDEETRLEGWGDHGKYDPANLNTGFISSPRTNCWISIKATAATFGKFTEKYTYQGAYLNFDANKTGEKFSNEIKWFYYAENKGSIPDGYYWSSEDHPTGVPSASQKFNENFTYQNETYLGQVYLKYVANKDIKSDIEDEIEKKGWLTYKHPTEEDIEYNWLRSDTGDDNDFTLVEPKKITGSTWNIVKDETGTHLYPALDLNKDNVDIRRWYKVQVLKDGKVISTTDPIQVPYYASLQNGSFETPNMLELAPDDAMDVPNGTTGLVWKTTGDDGQIEIINRKFGYTTHGVGDRPENTTNVSNYASTKIPAGDQYVELNAEQSGALYQTVLTAPGSTLYWKLSHKGRAYSYQHKQWYNTNGGYYWDKDENGNYFKHYYWPSDSDVMYLIVAPTDKVKDITMQDQLKELIENKATYEKQGYFFQKISSKVTDDWQEVSGKYTVPDKAYLTNFFFAAYSTATGSVSVGNLLDNVSFSTKLPAPDPSKANIEVQKIVDGVQQKDLKDYHVKIELQEWTEVEEWKTKQQDTLNFDMNIGSASTFFENIDADKRYRIIETPSFDGTTGNSYKNSTSKVYVVNNGNSSKETEYTSTGVIIDAEDRHNYQVTLTNTYAPEYVSLTVEKLVESNMGNEDQNLFTFTATVKVDGENVTSQIAGDYTVKAGETADVLRNVSQSGIFQLASGEYITIDKIPYGAEVTIAETGGNSGYETKYIVDAGDDDPKHIEEDGTSYTIEKMNVGHKIKFINTKNVVIPTGLFDNGHPTGWLYLMAAAAGCFAFGFYRRRKKKLNNGEECL